MNFSAKHIIATLSVMAIAIQINGAAPLAAPIVGLNKINHNTVAIGIPAATKKNVNITASAQVSKQASTGSKVAALIKKKTSK